MQLADTSDFNVIGHRLPAGNGGTDRCGNGCTAKTGLSDAEGAKAVYESILERDANHYPTLVWKALGLW